MPNANTTISFVQALMPPYELAWVNTARVKADWKVKIFQHTQSGRQFAIYDRATICILFEHDVPGIEGATRQPKRPKGDALKRGDSKFANVDGSYYIVDSLSSLELLIRSYLEEGPRLSPCLSAFNTEFANQVVASLADPVAERRARLLRAGRLPRKVLVQTTVFIRNPDVVADVLLRASGRCEICLGVAPFTKASDGKPYLEVHHKLPLANGGEDSVENAIATCPNCHRQAHYG